MPPFFSSLGASATVTGGCYSRGATAKQLALTHRAAAAPQIVSPSQIVARNYTLPGDSGGWMEGAHCQHFIVGQTAEWLARCDHVCVIKMFTYVYGPLPLITSTRTSLLMFSICVVVDQSVNGTPELTTHSHANKKTKKKSQKNPICTSKHVSKTGCRHILWSKNPWIASKRHRKTGLAQRHFPSDSISSHFFTPTQIHTSTVTLPKKRNDSGKMRDVLHNLRYFKFSYPSPSEQLFSLHSDVSER